MKLKKTGIDGVYIVEPQVFHDSRGWFMETYAQKALSALGIETVFVQDNQSLSIKKGTIRGLHFQNAPHAQGKLVRCTKGCMVDVAVDLRKNSPSYCKWVAAELSAQNKRQLFMPRGFAHGFLTLADDTEVQYKVDDYYCPECERSIRYDDPKIGIVWGAEIAVVSDKDQNAPFLLGSDVNFV